MSHHPERTARNVRPVNQPPSKRYILRYISLCGLGVSIFKLLCFDIANLKEVNRMGIFFVIGVLFMLLAFFYFKYRQRIVAEDDKKESDC